MRQQILGAIEHAIKDLLGQSGKPSIKKGLPITLDAAKNKEYGDLTTNIAFLLAKQLKKNPLDIAQDIVSHIHLESDIIKNIQVASPGFINFFLSNQYWQNILENIINQKDDYGRLAFGNGQKVLIEFVSANPTGPLHIGHGRCAAFGDTLANLLLSAGYKVTREYYINDAGKQIEMLGKSILARYRQIFDPSAPFPEEGYKGDYIKTIAHEIFNKDKDSFLSQPEEDALSRLSQKAADQILEEIRKDLKSFRVRFDNWFSENTLYEAGRVNAVISLLRDRGLIYEKEGAQWMKASFWGDQKDRVIIRSNGDPTYFASDIAYHQNKYERGFQKIIDIWGADHHGYVDRIKAVLKALEHPEESFSVLLMQMVKLVRHGVQIDMSTRKGTFTTLEEVIQEVGPDAARFFFLLRRHDSHLDFDLDLAKEKSADNPVYYCQYAHARICSIERKAEKKGVPLSGIETSINLLKLEEEMEIIKKLDMYPYMIMNAAQALEPHRLTFYLIELSTLFHKYYNAHRVITNRLDTTLARIKLIEAIKIVLKSCLATLGVSAPERM